MEPIRCHICSKPLVKLKYKWQSETTWQCRIADDDLSGHLYIRTLPKKQGKVVEYSFLLEYNNNYYIITSFCNLGSTMFSKATLYIDNCYYPENNSSLPIPKFYPLKLKEPLMPQFVVIFNNIKLLNTFV
jgi:hypothetical protein